jgi:hypothetical protein
MPNETMVPLADLVLDPRLQMRETMDFSAIDEYAENIFDLPPGKVIREGETMWLTAGWHRYHAHQKAKQDKMKCIVREGTFLDALAEAAGENHGHGLKRSDQDKWRAVSALLDEELWLNRSDRMIADACHVSQHLVAKARQLRARAVDTNGKQEPEKRTGKDGKERPAKKPKKPVIRCAFCIRCWPNTDQTRLDCTSCSELRKQAKKPTPTEEEEEPEAEPDETDHAPPPADDKILRDDDGEVVPQRLLLIFKAIPFFRAASAALSKASVAFTELEACQAAKEAKPLDTKAPFEKFRHPLKNAAKRCKEMRPSLVCPQCQGEGLDGCRCQGLGWLTNYVTLMNAFQRLRLGDIL